MKKILFVNACVRENSRTRELAEHILEMHDGEVREVNLMLDELKPLDRELLAKRDRLINENKLSDDMFRCARDFAEADNIVIAAPYWDLAFPAFLKIYLEQITVCGITFRYENNRPRGLCRAKRLIYVTTAGGPIYLNFGFEYVKALAQSLYGIGEVLFFKAENLDIDGIDVSSIMQSAKREISEYFKNT